MRHKGHVGGGGGAWAGLARGRRGRVSLSFHSSTSLHDSNSTSSYQHVNYLRKLPVL